MAFTFGKNTVGLEIGGKSYDIDPFAESVLHGINEYRDALAGLDVENGPTSEAVETVCDLVKKLVENTLGPGSYEEIFAGREKNLLDHQELASYLFASIMAFRQKRLRDFTASGLEEAKKILESP